MRLGKIIARDLRLVASRVYRMAITRPGSRAAITAREVTTRNWVKQVEKDNVTPMNIDESDAEPGRPGKAPRLTSPPPTLMHSRYAGASAMVKRGEDDRGKNDKGGQTRSLPNPRERQ